VAAQLPEPFEWFTIAFYEFFELLQLQILDPEFGLICVIVIERADIGIGTEVTS